MTELHLALGDLVSVLQERARRHPDRVAIDFLGDGETITESLGYAALDERVRALAAELQSCAAPGDRALLLYPSGPDYVIAFLACLYAGVIGVPLFPPDSHQPQALQRLASVARDAAPAMVLTDAQGAHALGGACGLIGCDRVKVTSAPAASAADWRPWLPGGGDVAFLQYTSGSTACPKGVMVTHSNLLANQRALSHALREREGDCFVSWLPLYHDMGLILGLLQPLLCGLRLVLMSPRQFLERPRRWLDAIHRHQGTISFGSDFAYRLCVDRVRAADANHWDLSNWRVAVSGAEPIRHTTMTAFAQRYARHGFRSASFNPCYGLAEATLIVTGSPQGSCLATRFDAAALALGHAQPAATGSTVVACGVPHPATDVRIVDSETGVVLPAGYVGEIWLRGSVVAAGYWRNPDATARTFAARDASGDGPYLRTGDLGFLHDSQLYISSRLKDLIILRGRNVYPQDVELEVETRVAGVRAGRIAAFSVDHDGAEAIAVAAESARLRPGEGTPADVLQRVRDAVVDAFQEQVAAVALLEPGSLPRTSSGKLQRAATRQAWLDGTLPLVASYRAFGPADAPAVLENDTQRRLAALWEELLEVENLTPTHHFIELGGQSLMVGRLAARIRADFGVELSLAECFASQSLADMARRIDAAPRRSDPPSRGPAASEAVRRPLSRAQKRLWFLQSMQPESAYYHVAVGVRFQGSVDPARLAAALRALSDRHASLRCSVADSDGDPREVPVPAPARPLERLVLADERQFETAAQSFVERPFDWGREPLWRAGLVEGDGADPRLLLVMHHLVVDGASLPVLLRDLARAYRGECFDVPAPSYAEVAMQQDAVEAPAWPALAAKAAALLLGAPGLSSLPTDRPRPPQQSHRGAVLDLVLPDALVAQLERWARRQRATLFTVLFAAFARCLADATGQRDLVIGTDVAHRPGLGHADQVVGFFVNQVPVRWHDPGTAADGAAAIRATQHALLLAYERQELPFDLLVEAVRPVRSLAHAPIFQTKFVFQEWPEGLQLDEGVAMTLFDIPRHTSELDLLFDGVRRGDRVSFRIEYATDLYDSGTPQRLARDMLQRLQDWSGEPIGSPSPARALQRRVARSVAPRAGEVQA